MSVNKIEPKMEIKYKATVGEGKRKRSNYFDTYEKAEEWIAKVFELDFEYIGRIDKVYMQNYSIVKSEDSNGKEII